MSSTSHTYNEANYPEPYTVYYPPENIYEVHKTMEGEGFTVGNPVASDQLHSHLKTFLDPSIKFLFDNSYVYGHITTSWMYILLKQREANPDADFTVLIYRPPTEPAMKLNHMSGFTEYLEERLIGMGCKVEYIDTESFYATNFINVDQSNVFIRYGRLQIVADFFSEGLDYSTPPTKKTYLSRGKTTTYNGNTQVSLDLSAIDKSPELIDEIRDTMTYKFSDRINDEKGLEDYVRALGFDIVYPEDIPSYKDQLQLLASSRILMSLTSSSMSTCFVMAPNTTVVEVSTPLATLLKEDGTPHPEYLDFHDHYKILSSIRGSLYVSITNKTRSLDEVVNAIENTPGIKDLLSQ